MIWTLLLLLNITHAEDLAVERYCFASAQRASLINSKVQAILVPSDKLEKDEKCFVISMKPHRRELVQNYIRNLEPQVQISFSSAETRTDPCTLKIEKIKSLEKNQLEVQASSALDIANTQTKREMKETISIQTLKEFELTVDQDVVKGTCRYITPTRYEISLEVRKDPKPLIPGLPEGSTIIINQPVAPPDQETSLLKTTLQLSQGQRIEIGSTIKDLHQKQQRVEVSSPKLDVNQTDGEQQEKVFLSIE